MSEQESQNASHGGINIHSKISIYGTVIIVFAPLSLIALVTFTVFAFTHWLTFVAMTGTIITWALFLLGACCVILITWVASKALKSLIEALVLFGNGTAQIYRSFSEARGQRMRNRVIVTHDSYVVYEHRGEIVVKPVTQEKIVTNVRQQLPAPGREDEDEETPTSSQSSRTSANLKLPTNIRYEDIRDDIPDGHVLLGIGENGLETRDRGIRALVWIVGGSGTGKTNTVSIRVDEDYERGHRFFVIDPHVGKRDSLTTAIERYSSRFLMPPARTWKEIDAVLDRFLEHFERRKIPGNKWAYPITLLVDETGAIVDVSGLDDDEEDYELRKQIAAKIKRVARTCGQEARGFDMGGMFISQDAAYLAWLRKRATLVIVHQLVMVSEGIIACNENKEIARSMDRWPKGRTYVYGLDFRPGPIIVQQPLFTPRSRYSSPLRDEPIEEEYEEEYQSTRTEKYENVIDSTARVIEDGEPYGFLSTTSHGRPALSGDLLRVYNAYRMHGSSRRDIESHTGIPRSTVQRHIEKLIQLKYIAEEKR